MSPSDRALRWEEVYVFISSTFNDMHAERDYLVKRVFPELQEWCERRKLRLVDIDLRWGVTEADATRNRNVVKVCLDRVDECRPFFLCFLGQRRGWVPRPEDVSPDTLERFPELRSHLGDLSVTELEILHALINPLHGSTERDPSKHPEKYDRAKHAFFYLRDGGCLDALPALPVQLRRTYTNEWIRDAAERDRQDRLLARWRADIEHLGCPFHAYSAEWDEQASTPEIMVPLACPSVDPRSIERWRGQWADAGVDIAGKSVEDEPALADKARRFNDLLARGRLTRFASGGRELKDVILEDLERAILERHPDHVESPGASELQQELDQQEEFLFISSRGFIEREGAFAEIDEYLAGDSRQILVLTSPGGVGKSMLLAAWIRRCRRSARSAAGRGGSRGRIQALNRMIGHGGPPPADPPALDQTVHYRFIGQSDRSTTVFNLLRSLLLELQQAGKVTLKKTEAAPDGIGEGSPADATSSVPLDATALQQIWHEQMAVLGAKSRTVIVVDAINQLESGLENLGWLPLSGLPESVKLIVSLRDDAEGAPELLRTLESERRHVRLARVAPFEDLDDRRDLVNAYLSQYLKEIDERLLEEIVRLPAAGNPLFLKVVLAELRVWGSFARLRDKIHTDFGDSPVSAFEGVLRRLENDPAYSPIPPGDAVPLLFGLMAHARSGLGPGELAEMLTESLSLPRTEGTNEAALETVHLLLRQVRPFLARRNGRYDFFFESFKAAAARRYVTAAEGAPPRRTVAQWHRLLADYFQRLPLWEDEALHRPTARKVSELPYHLAMAGMWDEVEASLCDLRFLDAKCSAGMVAELQDDYEIALDRLPDRHSELEAEREWREIIRRWSAEIVAYSRQCSQRDKRSAGASTPAGPEPVPPASPPACRLWTDDEIAEENRRIARAPTRADRLRSFAGFVNASPHPLLQFGRCEGFVIQHAFGSAPDGPVHAASERLGGLVAAPMLLCQWRPGASYNPSPARLRTLEGHTAPVSSLCVTPDGRRAVSASGAPVFEHSDGTVRLWDVESGLCLKVLRGHQRSIDCVSMTPDGLRAVSGSRDQTVRVWNLETGECTGVLEHGSGVLAVHVTPDGLRAYSVDGTALRTWDLETMACAGTVSTGADRLAVAHDGRRALLACSGLEVWDVHEAVRLRTAAGPPMTPDGRTRPVLAMTPDGRLVVASGGDNKVHVWDLERDRLLHTLEDSRTVWSLAITPDGRVAASGNDVGKVVLWDLQDGVALRTLHGHSGGVSGLCLTPDARRAFTASQDRTIAVWNVENGSSPQRQVSSDIWGLGVTPDGKLAMTGSRWRMVTMWDLERGECRNIDYHDARVHSVSMLSDGRRALTGSADRSVRLWNLESQATHGEVLARIGVGAEVWSVAATPDGRCAITGGDDRVVRVWDLDSGRCLRSWQGHLDSVASVAVAPGGRFVASGSFDATIRVWDLDSGACLRTLAGHADKVRCVAIAPDGRRLVSGSFDTTIRTWDLESGKLLSAWSGHSAPVVGVCVTADGRHVVSASDDRSIRLWRVNDGACLAVYVADSPLRSLALFAGGNGIIGGSSLGDIHKIAVRWPTQALPSAMNDRWVSAAEEPVPWPDLERMERHRVAERAHHHWESRTGRAWWDAASNWLQAEEDEGRILEGILGTYGFLDRAARTIGLPFSGHNFVGLALRTVRDHATDLGLGEIEKSLSSLPGDFPVEELRRPLEDLCSTPFPRWGKAIAKLHALSHLHRRGCLRSPRWPAVPGSTVPLGIRMVLGGAAVSACVRPVAWSASTLLEIAYSSVVAEWRAALALPALELRVSWYDTEYGFLRPGLSTEIEAIGGFKRSLASCSSPPSAPLRPPQRMAPLILIREPGVARPARGICSSLGVTWGRHVQEEEAKARASGNVPFVLVYVQLPGTRESDNRTVGDFAAAVEPISTDPAGLGNAATSLWLGTIVLDFRTLGLREPEVTCLLREGAAWPAGVEPADVARQLGGSLIRA